jgi:hypothetical protein
MAALRPVSAGTSLSAAPTTDGLLLGEEEEEPVCDTYTLQPFLWEQISESIDGVEREEVERVVGSALVMACTDIYAEVRALHEIHREYAACTDELVKTCASMPRSMASQPAGLVQLELKSLVAQLRKRAAASGVHEDALLPTPSSPQRKALESVLQGEDADAAGGAVPPERSRTGNLGRPGTADSGRLSLREMRLGGGGASRPSTASQSSLAGSRPPTSSGGSRPQTAYAAPAAHAAAAPPTAAPPKMLSPRSSRPGSSRSGRPCSAASCSSAGSDATDAAPGSSGGRRERGGSHSGLVVSRLQAALEEERQALLAQAEALRLAIDDEHDYRGRVAQPPPSLTSLLELKRSLQDVLSRAEQHERLSSATRGLPAGGSSRLSQHTPLPDLLPGRVLVSDTRVASTDTRGRGL